MQSLDEFAENISDFHEIRKSEKIGLIAYYLLVEERKESVNSSDISDGFKKLRESPYSNIPQFLKQNSNLTRNRKRDHLFFYDGSGYILSRKFEEEIKERVNINSEKFLEFEIDVSKLNWHPNDVPFLNNSVRKHAHFFSKLYFLFYHLENSIRRFLANRLTSILGQKWEEKLIEEVDLKKALAIKRDVDLTNMLPNRGDNILYYCMWDDYSDIILKYPQIFKHKKEANEIIAHLGTLTKIRNAIAHNVATIPKEYQDELTVFLSKFIQILKRNQ